MAWIESHTVLGRHRKLKELAIALRLRPAYVIGHLHLLWHAALEQQEDGDLTAWTDEFIAEAAGFPGDAPQFVRLLQETGWLDDRLLHDWLDYSGRYLEAKYRTANPMRLRDIMLKHPKSVLSRSRVGPDNLTLPNQDNQPNQHLLAAFESVWLEYPKRIGKKAALSHYKATVKTESDLSRLRVGLAKYKAHVKDKELKYIQNGSTWFNNWQDWVDFQEEPNGANGSQGGTELSAVARAAREAQKAGKGTPAGEDVSGERDLFLVQAETNADA